LKLKISKRKIFSIRETNQLYLKVFEQSGTKSITLQIIPCKTERHKKEHNTNSVVPKKVPLSFMSRQTAKMEATMNHRRICQSVIREQIDNWITEGKIYPGTPLKNRVIIPSMAINQNLSGSDKIIPNEICQSVIQKQ